jgi:hypothetical protein
MGDCDWRRLLNWTHRDRVVAAGNPPLGWHQQNLGTNHLISAGDLALTRSDVQVITYHLSPMIAASGPWRNRHGYSSVQAFDRINSRIRTDAGAALNQNTLIYVIMHPPFALDGDKTFHLVFLITVL